MAPRKKLPSQVVERAKKLAAEAPAARASSKSRAPKKAPPTAREKIVAALKKLHPMD